MMAESARIPVEIQLILNKWTRDARTVVRDARAIDQALDDAKRSAKQLAAALNSIKSGKIAFDVDLSAIDKAASAAKSLDGLSPDVTVQVDTSQIMGAEIDLRSLDNFSPDVTVDVSVDAAQVQTQLNSITAPDLKVDVSANEEGIQTELNSLKAPDLKVDVSANTSAAESDIKSSLDELKGLAKIQIALEVLPMAGGIVGGLATPILEADRALKMLQGTTNEYIPDADRLISDIFVNGWGESRQEVAESIAQFVRLRGASGDLERSITSTFAAAQVTGFGFNEVLKASDKLVANGLVPTISDANDLIVATFQDGGDRAEDLLDTLTEYSPHFAALGISGATAMNLINQGLKLGTRDGDKLADTFKELGLRLEESVATEAGPYYDALVRTGLFDEAQAVIAGELSGAAFAEAAVDAANSGMATDFDLAEIFGTPLEDFGYDIFKNLDFSGAMEAIIPEDAAVNAAAVINDNLNQTLLETGRIMQEEVLARFGGLDGLLATINEKAQEFNSLVKDGVAFPEALEIILETPGLADSFHQFESVMGNLIIGIGTIVADVITLVSGEDAAAGIRAGVVEQSERQLTFDIQLADDAQGIVDAVDLALMRGVSEGDAGAAVSQAIADMISEGAIGSAQTLLVELGDNLDLTAGRGGFMEAIATLNEDINAALAEGDVLGAVKIFDAAGLEEDARAMAQPLVTALLDEMAVAAESGDWFKAFQMARPLEDMELLPDDQMFERLQEKMQEGIENVLSNIGQTAQGLKSGQLTIFEDLSIGSSGLAASQEELSAAMVNPVQVVAGALAFGQYDRAMRKATEAGWPITERELRMFGEVEGGVQAIAGQLSLYVMGVEDTERDSIAALEGLKTRGIDQVVAAQDTMLDGMDAYVMGVQAKLQVAEEAWQLYINFLAENGISLYEDNSLKVPTVPGKGDGLATGGRANPGWTLVGEQGPELAYFGQGADVLNNQTSSALMGLISQLGGGGNNTTNYINVNVQQNNASQAAGNASADRLSRQVRGFV